MQNILFFPWLFCLKLVRAVFCHHTMPQQKRDVSELGNIEEKPKGSNKWRLHIYPNALYEYILSSVFLEILLPSFQPWTAWLGCGRWMTSLTPTGNTWAGLERKQAKEFGRIIAASKWHPREAASFHNMLLPWRRRRPPSRRQLQQKPLLGCGRWMASSTPTGNTWTGMERKQAQEFGNIGSLAHRKPSRSLRQRLLPWRCRPPPRRRQQMQPRKTASFHNVLLPWRRRRPPSRRQRQEKRLPRMPPTTAAWFHNLRLPWRRRRPPRRLLLQRTPPSTPASFHNMLVLWRRHRRQLPHCPQPLSPRGHRQGLPCQCRRPPHRRLLQRMPPSTPASFHNMLVQLHLAC